MSQIQQSNVSNRLLRAMSSEDFALLGPHLERLPTPLKLVLIEPGTIIEHMYFPERGFTSVTSNTAGGGRIEVGMIGREGLVGASPVLLGVDRDPHEHFIQMAGSVLGIPSRVVVEAVGRSPSLRDLLLRYVQILLVQTAGTALANAAYTLETRLARWLLMCRDRADGDEMTITHEFLSMMLGVRRPGVTMAVQVLEGSGLIKATRGQIRVLNRAGLEALADDGYGLPEAEYDRLIGRD